MTTNAPLTPGLRYTLIRNIRQQASLISEAIDTDFRTCSDERIVDVDFKLTDMMDAILRARGINTDI